MGIGPSSENGRADRSGPVESRDLPRASRSPHISRAVIDLRLGRRWSGRWSRGTRSDRVTPDPRDAVFCHNERERTKEVGRWMSRGRERERGRGDDAAIRHTHTNPALPPSLLPREAKHVGKRAELAKQERRTARARGFAFAPSGRRRTSSSRRRRKRWYPQASTWTDARRVRSPR